MNIKLSKAWLIPFLLWLTPTPARAVLCDYGYGNSNLKILKELSSQLQATQTETIPFDRLDANPLTKDYHEKNAFSYYIGKGNERYEKLEGYDDIYLIIDHYDPEKHPLNRLFLGSHAVVKYDRTFNPPKIIFLSRQIHVSTDPAEKIRKSQSVNETLCSLNQACFKKLEKFNAVVDSAEYNSIAVNEYKNSLTERIKTKLLIDTYHEKPEIKKQLQTVLDNTIAKEFTQMSDVNTYLEGEMNKIVTSKLQGKTMEQYKAYIQKNHPGQDWLEYFDYHSIQSNISLELQKYSFESKKNAIFEHCKTGTSANCVQVNLLKKDLDYFQGKRTQIAELP